MKLRRLTAALGTGIAVLALAACNTSDDETSAAGGEDEPRFGGTMNVAFAEDPETFDPATCTGATCWGSMRLLYDRLYDYKDETNELQLQAAAAFPEISADGLTYTLELKPGLTFSDGRPVTAADVAYSYARVLDPATQAGLAEFWKVIEGAEEYASSPDGLPSGIEVVDDTTLTVTLAAPDAAFTYVLAMPAGSIIPEGSGDTIAREPVGSGPFVLNNFTPGQELVFDRNENYWDSPRPYVDQVVAQLGVTPDNQVLMVENGDIDLMADPIPPAKYLELTSDPALEDQIVEVRKPSVYYLTLNVETPPFDNPKVREAVSYAFNRDGLIRLVNGQGVPANEFIPPDVLGHTEENLTHDQDVEKAKDLMAEAGFPDGFSTQMYTWNIPPFSVLGPQIQQELKDIGIDAELQTLAPITYHELASSGKAPIGLRFWIADFPDGSDFLKALLSCAVATPGGQNDAYYCSPEMDQMVNAGLAEQDPEAIGQAYIEATKLMLAENPVVPLYFGTKTEFIGENVGNYHPQQIWGWDMLQYWKRDGSTTEPGD